MNLSKYFMVFALILMPFFCLSQERIKATFGELTEEDQAFSVYKDDPEAEGVVLYEMGNYYYDAVGDNIKLIKEVHRKIKILDSKKFMGSTVDIPLQVGEDTSEKLVGYRAMTHNGNNRSIVNKDATFLNLNPEFGKVFSIAFPNIKDGSVIEYVYKIESPFLLNFYGWEFQGTLPKIYSEFLFKIPIAYQFNNVLYGKQPLYINKSEVIKDCLQTTYNTLIVACPITLYAMKDIPAFKVEDYMLSPKNYIARVEFEPKEIHTSTGWRKKIKISSEWKDVDKQYRKGNLIGTQLDKKGYFKRILPDSILSISNDLDRAKAIYKFIKDHYTWDGTYYSSETIVKDAFEQKKGSIPEINISLINALEGAGFDAKLMLLSTRQNGLPTELYPVISKFNYTIAVLKIGAETYLLDATNKQAPFGVIPFRALNVQGRVMDFKNDSYWMAIEPYKQNIHFANAQISADLDGSFTGKVSQSSYGYIGLDRRNSIKEITLPEYIKKQQNSIAGIEIENYIVEDATKIEKPLKEFYNIKLEPELVDDKIIINPFFIETYFSENPFTMNERSYPMDFGYPISNTYVISINLGDTYKIDQLPKSKSVKLPGEDGEYSVTYFVDGNNINIRFNMKLATYRFQPYAYQSIKEFFGNMITILKDEPIVLKKL